MIEVLVALALVAFTMLGLLAIQLRTQGMQKDSLDRRTAALIAADFLERATGNFAGFRAQLYSGLQFPPGTDLPRAPRACTSACTASEVRDRDWWALQRHVATRLPGGVAFVDSPLLETGGGARWISVTVGWLDPLRVQLAADGDVLPDAQCPATLRDVRYRCFVARGYP